MHAIGPAEVAARLEELRAAVAAGAYTEPAVAARPGLRTLIAPVAARPATLRLDRVEEDLDQIGRELLYCLAHGAADDPVGCARLPWAFCREVLGDGTA